jgi:hypothetical protein
VTRAGYATVAVVALMPFLAGCGAGKITDPEKLRGLETIRAAVSKYKSLPVALGDGYRPLPSCIEDSSGSGALGLEYLQLRRSRDQTINLARPEQLFYAPQPGGRPPVLAGVGYFVPDEGQKPPASPLGHLDGPIPGQFFGEPAHFELHAWLFRKNPDGLLAFFNPEIDCPDTPH